MARCLDARAVSNNCLKKVIVFFSNRRRHTRLGSDWSSDVCSSDLVGEVAELASKEVPNRDSSAGASNDSVFFLQTGGDGALMLWVGAGSGLANLKAIQANRILPGTPMDLRVPGFGVPFRVAATRIADGSYIYLGLSERDELRVLRNLRARFILLWLLLGVLGFGL